MEIAIILLTVAFIAAAVTAVIFGEKLRREMRYSAKMRCDVEAMENLANNALKDKKDLLDQLASNHQTVSALSQKIGDLKATNERLVDKCNDADEAITTACLALNNFKGNSKVVDEARNVLKKYITEAQKQ